MIDYKNKIKVIGFDLDQTLYEKSPEIDAAIQSYIYDKIAEFKKCSREEAEKLFKDLYKNGAGLSGGQSLRALGLENGSEIVQEALENADIDKFLSPNPNTIELLKKLKEKYKNIDLITGSNELPTDRKLQKLGIDKNLFTYIFSNTASKSDGTVYRMWLEKYKEFKPEEFLYIGDRPKSDYQVPLELGICAILVNIKSPDKGLDCQQLTFLAEIENLLI